MRNHLVKLLRNKNSDCAKFLRDKVGVSGSRVARTVLGQFSDPSGLCQQNSGEQLSPCIRDALRQFFPQQNAQGKTYSPVDDARFKNWIPGKFKAAAHLPGAVNPAAITLGLYDIHYDPKSVNITGGNSESLRTIIEEVSHTVQFLQVWGGLKQNPYLMGKHGIDSTSYDSAKSAWQSHYAYYAVKGLGYDNDVEKWAKGKVQEVMNGLRLHAAPNQSQVCGFNLYP